MAGSGQLGGGKSFPSKYWHQTWWSVCTSLSADRKPRKTWGEGREVPIRLICTLHPMPYTVFQLHLFTWLYLIWLARLGICIFIRTGLPAWRFVLMVCLSQSPHYQRTTANKVALALSYKLVEFPINFFTSIPSFSPLKAFIVKLVATRLLASLPS